MSRQLSVLASTKQRSRLGEGGLGLDERQVAQFVQRATGSYSLLVDKRDWDAYRRGILAWGAVLGHGADQASPQAAAAPCQRLQLQGLLSLPSLRSSLIFSWARDALRNSDSYPTDTAACSAEAVAGLSAYSPEGPGSIVLSSDDSNSEGMEPACEDLYMAARRQMCAGMAPRRKVDADQRSAKQKLTGGAGSVCCRV